MICTTGKSPARLLIDCMRFVLTDGKEPDWEQCATQWQALIERAREQAVEGLLYDVIRQCPAAYRPHKTLWMPLYAQTLTIEDTNRYINRTVCGIFAAYAEAGAHAMLMKGQAVGINYPAPLHRSPGDIDIFLPEGFDAAHRWMLENGRNIALDAKQPKHIHFEWRGIPIENHFKLAVLHHRKLNSRMQRIVHQALQEATANEQRTTVNIDGCSIETLPPTLALLHLIVHFSVHLLSWGIGLRQLHDITIFMRQQGKAVNKAQLDAWINELKLGRVATAIAQTTIEYYGLQAGDIPFTLTEGKALNETLVRILFERGNFGHNGKRTIERSIGELTSNTLLYLRQCRETHAFYPEELRATLLAKLRRGLNRLADISRPSAPTRPV